MSARRAKRIRRPSARQIWGGVIVVFGVFLLWSYVQLPIQFRYLPWHVSRLALIFLVDVPLAFLQIGVAAWLNRRICKLDDRRALMRMGFLNVSPRSLLAGLGVFAATVGVEMFFEAMVGGHLKLEPRPLPRVLYILINPGLCEEAIFRGFVQRNLRDRFKAWPAILISAALFSAAHWQHLASGWTQSPAPYAFIVHLTGLLLSGVVLGWLYELGGYGLPACILAHIGGDTSVLYGFWTSPGVSPTWMGLNGWMFTWPLGLLLGAAVVWLILRPRRKGPRRRSRGA